jgi:transcriptional regulator GlxA family with amidase domain
MMAKFRPSFAAARSRPPMRSRTLAVVAFDGISPFHLAVPCLVFGEDRRPIGVPRFEVLVCSVGRRRLATAAGFDIDAHHGLDALADAGTVIVPSWRDDLAPPPRRLLEALREAHRGGARIVGLCLGAFVLAEAGLLDGRRATTHWAWAGPFAERFPRVRLDPDALYVDEGDVLTSAGTAAAIDCCLHMVRTQSGAEVANRLARRLVVAPHRRGGQAQFIELPVPADAGTDRIGRAVEWALERLAEPITLERVAAIASMSTRTFTRRFRVATGHSFKHWLIDQRLLRARRLLEVGGLSVDQVASACGFGTALSMRLHFGASLGLSPAAYRKAFHGSASPGS